ncbi:MAG: PilN domain-containing protein [Gammaproteobacteria bacterium]|nr:PilN domain-containing protein [Gammaproteobacteria bacterium]NIR58689.1 PilN domain-containing protein [Gammaproteobacteria bacterium]NIR90350.1 PilN domain-containing protein [Gammaproteobacteria bacterium]
MRLETNFAPSIGRTIPWLIGIGGLATASLWALAIWLSVDRARLEQASVGLAERMAHLRARREALAPAQRTLPSAEDIAAVHREVSEVNALTDVRGRPAVAILASLERLLPEEAYLTRLRHRHQTGEVQLVAEAPEHEALTELLHRLENAPEFTEALLVRQARVRAEETSAVRFEIQLREAGYD